jgi:hypothetical protein
VVRTRCPVVWEGWRRETSPYPDLWRKAVIDRSPNVSEVQQETCAKSRSRRPLMQELFKRDWPAA